MADYRDRGTRGEISLAKYVCHVLVLLRVEILQKSRTDNNYYGEGLWPNYGEGEK